MPENTVIQDLEMQVTSQIYKSNDLWAEARTAFAEVSKTEQALAAAYPLPDLSGIIARAGAVRAAIHAREYEQAITLCDQYLAEIPVKNTKNTLQILGLNQRLTRLKIAATTAIEAEI